MALEQLQMTRSTTTFSLAAAAAKADDMAGCKSAIVKHLHSDATTPAF
jgi:hypothetical protein